MPDTKLRFVGCYLSDELYQKFRLKCFKKSVSLSKELMALIMIDCKNVKLEVKEENAKESPSPTT